MNMETVKTKCFAFEVRNGEPRCKALRKCYCAYGSDCNFYKTKTQVNEEDRESGRER